MLAYSTCFFRGCSRNTYLDSPFTPHALAPDFIDLALSETLGLNSWVISKTIPSANLLRRHRCDLLAICTLVDCDYHSSSKTKVVLQSGRCAFHEAVIGPSSQVLVFRR